MSSTERLRQSTVMKDFGAKGYDNRPVFSPCRPMSEPAFRGYDKPMAMTTSEIYCRRLKATTSRQTTYTRIDVSEMEIIRTVQDIL